MKILLLFISLLLYFTPHVSAQNSWEIRDFNSTILIQKSGTVLIKESISVDFNTLNKHGIYRNIPYIYNTKSDEKRYSEITIQSVERNDRKEKFAISKNDSHLQIKIGDPDKTISQQQKYTITYLVKGVLDSYNDFDEFYWNVTGNDWEVPISSASSLLTIETGEFLNSSCYQGVFGATTLCSVEKISPQTLTFTSTKLSFQEGLTIAASFPKGTIPILSIEKPKSLLQKVAQPHILFLGGFLSLIGVGSILLLWYINGRDYWHNNIPITDRSLTGRIKPIGAKETLVVEFESPEKLTPAEIGVLMDEKADTLDVTATLIDLATKGYLSITEVEKKWVFGTRDYILKKKKGDTSSLLIFEKELFTRLFSSGDEISLSSLKQKFYDDLRIVKTKLYEEIVKKEIFFDNPESIRSKYVISSIIGFFIALFSTFYGGVAQENPYFLIIGISLLITCIFLFLFSEKMPRRTAHGRELYRRARGFKRFLSGSEKNRQNYYEQKNLFNYLLPYAITFGVTEKFAKHMKDLGQMPESVSWYSGPSFHLATLSSSMNTFSSTLSTAMASTPSSSGSSGGGFSGGGGGGGGGGSW